MQPKLLYRLWPNVLRDLDASPVTDMSRPRTIHIDPGYRPKGGEELIRLHHHRIRVQGLQSRELAVASKTTLEAYICLGQPIVGGRVVPEESVG
jgi:hypothetical protein